MSPRSLGAWLGECGAPAAERGHMSLGWMARWALDLFPLLLLTSQEGHGLDGGKWVGVLGSLPRPVPTTLQPDTLAGPLTSLFPFK